MSPLRILRYKRLQSTNTTTYQLGEKGEPEWTVVVAEVQTRGRGRAGRKWESSKGGLWFSTLLRPKIPIAKVPILQFFAANAVRQALKDEGKINVQLKWPNDLVFGTGKLGGILVETKTQDDKVIFTVLGIGLNIKQPRRLLPAGAVSLNVLGVELDPQKLLKAIIHELKTMYPDLDDPLRVTREWWRNCVHRPLKAQVVGPSGSITGITTGIDQEGSLILETEDHTIQRVSDGTLRLLDESTA